MQRLHKFHLQQLRAHRGAPALSLYLPTEDADPVAQAADLGLLIDSAETRLKASGILRCERESLLGPIRDLAEDIPFWTSWSMHNLTIFAGGGQHLFLRSPYRVEAQVSLGERFYLVPLLPILREDFHFYLLELRPTGSRLHTGDLYHLRELAAQELPAALRGALRSPKEGLASALAEFAAGLPVVVTGPELLRAELQLPSVERLDTADSPGLEQAWRRLRRWLDEDRSRALARCEEGLDAADIIRAAEAGRVAVLVVGEPSEEANRAALAVLDAGGQVYVAPAGPLRAALDSCVSAQRR